MWNVISNVILGYAIKAWNKSCKNEKSELINKYKLYNVILKECHIALTKKSELFIS